LTFWVQNNGKPSDARKGAPPVFSDRVRSAGAGDAIRPPNVWGQFRDCCARPQSTRARRAFLSPDHGLRADPKKRAAVGKPSARGLARGLDALDLSPQGPFSAPIVFTGPQGRAGLAGPGRPTPPAPTEKGSEPKMTAGGADWGSCTTSGFCAGGLQKHPQRRSPGLASAFNGLDDSGIPASAGLQVSRTVSTIQGQKLVGSSRQSKSGGVRERDGAHVVGDHPRAPTKPTAHFLRTAAARPSDSFSDVGSAGAGRASGEGFLRQHGRAIYSGKR